MMFLKELFTIGNVPEESENPEDLNYIKRIQIATCALFLEIANADNNFDAGERAKIVSVMRSTFKIEPEYVQELMLLAENSVKKSSSIYEYTSLVKNSFNRKEKFDILENLWRLVFIDELLDRYEDKMMKSIGYNLGFDTREILSAKLGVLDEMKKKKEL
ncbi:MAG: TerB family tellurite resistance protein [Ignavibacteria bacterium]|nr:TerB family tellurite resistance protein [Ignavibacteria bacterium]MCU7519585.1 TerB family tellurite resistance protein [Ignavibacteria bacterium]